MLDRPQKRLYSVQEAGLYLGRSVWGIRELIYAGKLACVRDGRRVLIDIEDMDQYIKRNKTVLL
jgi:excisionase family DNA binding protein